MYLQAKLQEVWKALNIEKYPLQILKQSPQHPGTATRADALARPVSVGKTVITQKTCISDAIKQWNIAPNAIKKSTSLNLAKKEIKIYTKSLPI